MSIPLYHSVLFVSPPTNSSTVTMIFTISLTGIVVGYGCAAKGEKWEVRGRLGWGGLQREGGLIVERKEIMMGKGERADRQANRQTQTHTNTQAHIDARRHTQAHTGAPTRTYTQIECCQ